MVQKWFSGVGVRVWNPPLGRSKKKRSKKKWSQVCAIYYLRDVFYLYFSSFCVNKFRLKHQSIIAVFCLTLIFKLLLTWSPTLPVQPPSFPLIWIGPSSVVTFLSSMSSGVFLLSFISIVPVDKLTSAPTGVFCNTAAASFSSLSAFSLRAWACCKQTKQKVCCKKHNNLHLQDDL